MDGSKENGRRKKMKINRTRERILDKSIELFNRKQASNDKYGTDLDRTGNQPGKSVLLLHQQGRSDPLHLERTDGAGDHGDPGNSRGNQR